MSKKIHEFLGEGNAAFAAFAYETSTSIFDRAYRLCKKSGYYLSTPNFSIVDVDSYWGKWFPEKRVIRLNIKLFRDFSDEAICFVIFHEIAHMIVSEVFKMGGEVDPHGEAFKKACDILGIECKSCASMSYLDSIDHSTTKSDLIRKIRALLSKGRDEAVSKEESEKFLYKAFELSQKHKIEMSTVFSDPKFVSRPIGPISARTPTYVGYISSIVKDFYNVKTIYSNIYMPLELSDGRRGKMSALFAFGRKEDVDIAEYIAESLVNQADNIYRDFLSKKDKSLKTNRSTFFSGLFYGLYNSLIRNKQTIKDNNPDYYALISMDDPLLDEMYEKQYPTRIKRNTSSSRRCGFHSGVANASKLSLHSGVNGNKKQLLLA